MANNAKISPKSPSFFRIILPHILENGILELQKDFVKEHWKSFSKHACLEVPTGAKSKMKMKMSNGRAQLQEGWKDFAEKYSIKVGYFLVFTYHGRSNFSVQIFDPSTQEIEYKEASLRTEVDSDIIEGKCDDEKDGEMEIDNHSREKAVVGSRNPSFSVIMKPTNNVTNASRRASYVHIPKIAESYFRDKGKDNIYLSLKGGNGKIWTMKYYPGTPPKYLTRIGLGWREFSEENNLKEGDMCTFEVLSSTDMAFNVTISRKNDEQVDLGDPAGVTGTKRKRELECNETSFAVRMVKTNVEDKCRLKIPRVHSRRYLHDQNGTEVFLHRLDGKKWRVKCYNIGSISRFDQGWKEFVAENELQVGDTCVFELCSRNPNHYKVAVFSDGGSPGLD